MSPASLRVLAHRGLLDGPDRARENRLDTLRAAGSAGFGLEFDVRLDGHGRLVLSHDPADWSADHDAEALLADPPGTALHALNVKDPVAVVPALDVLERAGTAHRFFLFDFELACKDADEAAALAAAARARGAAVARRLSDREPVLDELVAGAVDHVWLDELDDPWVNAGVVARLISAGKTVWYVSPELHRLQSPADLRRRWSAVCDWGVSGICTDHPMALSAQKESR
jgi:glycerophosphoryl diester phosphodiesterase